MCKFKQVLKTEQEAVISSLKAYELFKGECMFDIQILAQRLNVPVSGARDEVLKGEYVFRMRERLKNGVNTESFKMYRRIK
jgi:hypothetical protein